MVGERGRFTSYRFCNVKKELNLIIKKDCKWDREKYLWYFALETCAGEIEKTEGRKRIRGRELQG